MLGFVEDKKIKELYDFGSCGKVCVILGFMVLYLW